MTGVFYNEKSEKKAVDSDDQTVEVAGVYASEPEWSESEITTVPDEHIIMDSDFWSFEEGNIVCIGVDGEVKPKAYRICEKSGGDTIEPSKLILRSPDLSEKCIFSLDSGRYIIEKKNKNKPAQIISVDPMKKNTIYPIRDDWLMDEFNETHQLMAKIL